MATGKNKEIQFPTEVPQGDVTASRKVTHLTFWRQAARTNYMGQLDITDSAVVQLGQRVVIPANVITWTFPTPSNGSAFTALEAVLGVLGTAIYIDAHYGSPGNAHTANRFSGIGQLIASPANWTTAA